MIDKNSPIPIYHQLEENIKSLIKNGNLKPGDIIPSEREYAEKYEISRMTVRQAISNLVNERLLYRIKGRGTFVMEKKIEQNLQGLTSFTEDMRARGMQTSNQLLSFKIIPANKSLADDLGISEHGPVYEIKRVRLADQIPMALEKTYISANLVKGLTEEVVQDSLYKYIEDTLRLKISGAFQLMEAAVANEEEVKYLEIRSEEHTSELQSRGHLVCRLLLEKENEHAERTDSHAEVRGREGHPRSGREA